MRILAAQINPTIGDFEGNTKKILNALEHAKQKGMDVVLFSEMSLCGYPPEDLLMHDAFVQEMEKCLDRVIKASKGLFVAVGLVRRNDFEEEKPLFNSAAIVADGRLLGFQDKRLLPTYDVFDERRYFEPGKESKVWEYKGKRIAVTICEDIWQHAGTVGYTHYARDPIKDLSRERVDLLLNLSASPYHFQKPDARVQVGCKTAMTLKCPFVMCCQVGGMDQLVFDGYSFFLDGEGKLRKIAKGFHEELMEVDLNDPPKPLHFIYDPIKDLYEALVLGLRDYFHKQGFKKGCLGLSGGIDSSLVACIAVEALGKENVLGVAMPSRYSSPSSVKDAEDLCHNLNIELLNIPIEGPFDSFLHLLGPHFKGRKPDVTEENLQARIRGMILMALSNKHGYIVMSTGNKSELAMGYCTLYGDMAGGLGIISDVTKQQVYALSKWINREKEIIPRSSIEKPPSAELKPNQLDTDSLPEYRILDVVLQSYVEEFLSPDEIAKKYDLSFELVKSLVHKIHLAEYKRRQAPPGIRVSKKAFGVGRRYPIVQKWA